LLYCQFGNCPGDKKTADIIQISYEALSFLKCYLSSLKCRYHNSQGTNRHNMESSRSGANCHIIGQNHRYPLVQANKKAFLLTGVKFREAFVFYKVLDF